MIMLVYIIINVNVNIFYGEIIYILNFAFFYIYLHFIQPATVTTPDIADLTKNIHVDTYPSKSIQDVVIETK